MRKILLICLLIFLSVSCDENVSSPVPLAKVNLRINLVNDKPYFNLNNGPLYYVIANEQTIAPEYIKRTDAFGCKGLLLIVNIDSSIPYDIRVYDLYCPNDGVAIHPDKPAFSETATCPACKAQYNTGNGGFPVKGSKHWLKSYNVYYRDTTGEYIVTN